jgi:hypothetical protein
VVVLSLVVVAISAVFAQLPAPQHELQGIKPYTPTRLEWLAVELNVRGSSDYIFIESLGYRIAFVPYINEDTIVLSVLHARNANRKLMNRDVDAARKLFDMAVKNKGWDSWVKLREKVEMAEE